MSTRHFKLVTSITQFIFSLQKQDLEFTLLLPIFSQTLLYSASYEFFSIIFHQKCYSISSRSRTISVFWPTFFRFSGFPVFSLFLSFFTVFMVFVFFFNLLSLLSLGVLGQYSCLSNKNEAPKKLVVVA